MKYNSWDLEILSLCLYKFSKMLGFVVLFAVYSLPYSLGSKNVYHLNERDFEGYIRDKDVMLVDFFAPWCHHCQALSPELDAAADQLATKNQFVFAKVDCVNDGKQLCQRFNIQGYPTIKLFKYGQYVGDYVGQRDRGSLMQYMDSVASTINQHTPLTTGAINYGPQTPLLPSHLASSIHAPAPAIAPTFMHQANILAKNPSLMASFYGSAAQAQHPPPTAAYLGNAPPLQQASPDSLQSKFGNLASLDIYRSKLKMIAAYKNYQRRLGEYREKLLAANRAKVNPNQQGLAGAVTQPPRPGVNAFAQPQSYRGYYRPEAVAAQNVQINRANPQLGYGAYTMNYPNQYASPYGYQALASSPYYRSKTGHHGKRHHGKNNRPAAGPASVRKTAYNRQPGRTKAINQANYYYKQKQFEKQQQQQQFRQQLQKQRQQQELHEANHQQQFYPNPPTRQQHQDNKPQAPQPEANPAPPSPPKSSDPLVATDTTALKDLKADIESAIQDALKNAVTKESNNKLQTPSVQVDGERAKPQTKATHSDQSGSGSGAHSQSSAVRASGTEDVVTGEGSGSGVKPSSK